MNTGVNTPQVNRGRCLAALLLAVGLGFIVLAVASAVMAQSSEAPDPLELYDENDNGVIDGDEAFQAIEDHFAGLIDQALTLKVLNLYLGATGAVGGQSWPSACDEYDSDDNDVIDKSEAIDAVLDYFNGVITKDEAITVIVCYFNAPTPSPTPTPGSESAPAPTELQATASTAGSVTLSWDSVTDAYLYQLERSASSSGPWTSVSSTINGTSHTAAGLTCNTYYYFRVSTRGDGSPYPITFGDPSSNVFRRTSGCPDAPTGFTVTVDRDGPDGIVLKWTAPSGEVTGYEVQRRVVASGASYSAIATLASTARSHSDTTVTEGTSYQYQVRARNSGGDGSWATSGSITFKIILDKWLVLSYRTILINWVIPESDRSSDHQYKLVVPADTGFQINPRTAPNRSQCNWQSPPSTETSWVDLDTSFYLVRCKLGTGTADIVVKKRPKSGTNRTESTVRTIEDINQSWHQVDNQIGYKITSPLLGTRPSGAYPGYTPLSQENSTAGISEAASIWNEIDPHELLLHGQPAPLTFDSVSASPDVTVRGYWNPGGDQSNDKCLGSIACVYFGFTYPHFGHQELWIEYPPQFAHDGYYKRWTDDPDDARRSPYLYYDLPGVMMHEFGHTAGLGETTSSSSIMGPYQVWEAPQLYDRNGMKYIYQGHSHTPDAPAGPTLTARQGQIAVSWTAPGDGGSVVTSYIVQWRATGGTWVTTASGQASVTAGTAYTITGLTGGTTYEVRVAAVNEFGTSDWSTTASATPTAPGS